MTTANQADKRDSGTSLYVGDLHPDVTDAELLDAFSTAGPISRIRVCRDQITERSLGYAFVKFEKEEDAETALGTIDSINGQPIRIMWSAGDGKVFIKNLDKSMDTKALYDIFDAFGNILSCKVICDDHGSCGYGFVLFETEEAARNAIYKVNGILLNGKRVYVSREMNEDDIIEIMADKTQKFKNVYIKNFGIKMSEKELKELFEPYGKITSLKIMTDVRGESRGFGFVCYQNSDDAEKAVEELNDIVINGKTLYVGRAQNKTERQAEIMDKNEEIRKNKNMQYDGLNVYVKNLDRCISDKRLRNEFSQFGTISSAKVMTTEDGISKGFGFVCFSSPEEANKAVTEMNGIVLADKALYVCLAQRKDVRKAILSTQYPQNNGQNCKMSQILSTDEPRYSLSTMTQAHMNFYSPIPVPHSSPIPRWQALHRQPPPGFESIPGPQMGDRTYAAIRARQPGQFSVGTPATMLANADEQKLKQMLGHRLFLLIQKMYPDLAGAITGMLMKRDNSELSKMLESRELLEAKARKIVDELPAQKAKDSSTFYTGGAIQVDPQGPLTAAVLGSTPEQEQRHMLQGILFSMIQKMYPDLAKTITEMLLEADNAELLVIMKSKESFESKVHEVVAVLHSEQANDSTTSSENKVNVNQSQETLTATMLATASQQEQEQMLGERLFPLILNMYPDLAGKITGMLLEMDNLELLKLLKSKESLEAKVQEAVAVLQAHQDNNSSTSSNIPVTINAHPVTGRSVTEQPACIPLIASDTGPTATTPVRVPMQSGRYSERQIGNPTTIGRQANMIRPPGQSACMMSQMFPSVGPGYIFPNSQTQMPHPIPSWGHQGFIIEQGQYPFMTHQTTPPLLQANVRGGSDFQDNLSRDSQRPADVRPDSSNNDSISAFNDIIYETTLRPGNLEETTDLIAQILQNCSGDQVLSSILHVVDTLFEKSITEQSFQCTGATIVKYLSDKLSTVPAFANFRNFFLTRCKEEYLKRDDLISNPGSVPRICGFANFIGNLFLNWEVTTDGVKQRIPVLRFMIRDVLLVLLKHSTDDTVICATEILKRTGALMEETAHLNGPAEGNFSEVFSQIGQLELQSRLNETTKYSITSLLKLKSRKWDRRDSLQLRATRSVTQNKQTDHELESSLGSITLENNAFTVTEFRDNITTLHTLFVDNCHTEGVCG
ncbi:polyadenylate-binding protein 1-like isoform X2 [Mytilus galloprovincialis]|uniref:polyadenylate-binding protein 1-like isoform X2 n=1 Tax=Mytilus galloprovincialis TaxID=29158 RepID=UPI003F7C1A55